MSQEEKFKYRNCIELLHKQGHHSASIQRTLKSLYGDEAPSPRTVLRWVNKFQSGESSVKDKSIPGRPITKATERNSQRVEALLKKDNRLTINEIRSKVKLSWGTVWRILRLALGLSLVCAKWIPKV